MQNNQLTFDKNGYLVPYDTIPTDWDTVVKTFGGSSLRQQLLVTYEHFLAVLRPILPVSHNQWIGGSFVSQQENPGDLDLIVFVPHTHFRTNADLLKQLKTEWSGSIDCYFVETFPPDHRKYEIGRADALTWYHFLRLDRRKRPKGILDIHVDYGNQ